MFSNDADFSVFKIISKIFFYLGSGLSFPNNADDIVTVAANSVVRIPFAMDSVETMTKELLLAVDRVFSINNTTERLCTIIYTPDAKSYWVSDARTNCRQVAGPVPLLFSMNVSRQDDGARLTWRGAWRGASARTFVINVTCERDLVDLS